MMDSYDLFSAMNGADEELIARSDYRARQRRYEWLPLLAIAACFALIVFSIVSRFLPSGPETLHNPPTIATYETEYTESATVNPNQPLQLSGSSVGTLNIVELSHVENTDSMPDFLMYINQEKYHIAESAGTYYIYPISGGMENQMTLCWQGNVTLKNAAQQQIAALASTMEHIWDPESDALLGGILIRGSSDTEQAEVYIADDLHGGVFIFTLKYAPEDPEGHTIWFRDMLQTFEVVTTERDAPAWMTDLRSSVESFTAAFLKNDFTGMDGLIAENAEIYTYNADVCAETRILQTHYNVDNDAAPTSAYVSVRHKYIEDDAYDYITMELKYSDGKWQVAWAMIER